MDSDLLNTEESHSLSLLPLIQSRVAGAAVSAEAGTLHPRGEGRLPFSGQEPCPWI